MARAIAAAVNDALERAAKVADAFRPIDHDTAEGIAVAIRNLKEPMP